jgi:hypothetical protein
MLNCIIRLQAVVEIITNETARALNLLAKQGTKMRNAIFQNHLVLDYLLASEGRVCEKFNLNNFCLQIDDEGQAIEEITEGMTKLGPVSPSRLGKDGILITCLEDDFLPQVDLKHWWGQWA